jgi:hypothetical protein
MTASVPDVTSRSISIEGIQEQIISAMSTSPGVQAPKVNPFLLEDVTAEITSG